MSEGTSSETRCPESQSRLRDWLSSRWVLVLLWTVISLAASAATSLLPGFQDATVNFALEKTSDELILWIFVLAAVLVAPVIETGLMAVLIFGLRRLHVRNVLRVVLVACLLSLMHQSFGTQATSVLPVFLIFTYVYVSRTRAPYRDGFALTTIIHTLNNLVPTIALITYRYSTSV